MQKSTLTLLSTLLTTSSLSPLFAHTPSDSIPLQPEINWLTGEGVSLGGILFPSAHFQAAYGGTSADGLDHFGAGHHDPVSDGWTIQGFEFGASLRPTEWFEAFGSYHLYQDAISRNWDGKFEEWFVKFKNLPGGFELRGGRFLNRFGLHNSTHLHGWNFIDNNLVNGRFLGDDGLNIIGGEISWKLPTPWTSMISVSVGQAQGHGHDSTHAHSEDHTHHEVAAEDLLFKDTVTTVDWTHQFHYNDFHQFRAGLSGAWGENEMGYNTQVYGIHFQYEWRENGLEAGGKYFRWRTEAMFRDSDYLSEHTHVHVHKTPPSHKHEEHDHLHEHEEHDHEEESHETEEVHSERKSAQEFGIYTSLIYGMTQNIELGLRGDYVSGVKETSANERFRVSPSATCYFNSHRNAYLRAQYNYDHSPTFKDEHSVWLQVGIHWGGHEVR